MAYLCLYERIIYTESYRIRKGKKTPPDAATEQNCHKDFQMKQRTSRGGGVGVPPPRPRWSSQLFLFSPRPFVILCDFILGTASLFARSVCNYRQTLIINHPPRVLFFPTDLHASGVKVHSSWCLWNGFGCHLSLWFHRLETMSSRSANLTVTQAASPSGPRHLSSFFFLFSSDFSLVTVVWMWG